MRSFSIVIVIIFILLTTACTKNREAVVTAEKTTVSETFLTESTEVTDNDAAGANAQLFFSLEMTEEEIFSLYMASADKVKVYSAGFSRSFSRKTGTIEVAGGSTALGSCIASLAVENNFGAALSASDVIIEHGDALSVNAMFPIYGEEHGCREQGLKCVSKASCGENEEYYSITIHFSECAGSGGKSNLGAVLALDTQKSTGELIAEMLGESAETVIFSEYSNCFLSCVIEKTSLRMVYLEQNIGVCSYIDVVTDMFVFADCQTQLMCPYADEIIFYNFDWN